MADLLTYTEALSKVLQEASPLTAIPLSLDQVLGHIAAEDMTADTDLPRFDNSAMDGYALRFEHTAHASVDHPMFFPVAATVAAGDAVPQQRADAVYAIMTGAVVPSECNAVIPIEKTRFIDKQVVIAETVSEHANIRFKGEDICTGQVVIQQGERIHAGHIAVLASLGHSHVRVYPRPKVALISTGKEVVSDFAQTLSVSQIYNSNTPYLAAQLVASGIQAHLVPHIPDDTELFKQAITQSTQDLIISTGAVSMGQWDFIPSALVELGANIVFHKVAQKPGKPILFARLKDGRYFFGLPGNPASCAVGLRFFVQPLLRALQGLPQEVFLDLPLSESYEKKGNLRHFLKARVDWQKGSVSILNGQESFKISPLLQANAWVVLPETQHQVAAQTAVSVVSSDLFSPWV